MKIFDKIEINNEAQKLIFDNYKYEMKLAFSVLLAIILGDIAVSYQSPVMLVVFISIQLLIFTKYLYDRRVKLKNDIIQFK